MKNIFFYSTIVGKIAIVAQGNAITGVSFCDKAAPQDADLQETDVIRNAARQLTEYFAGQRKTFDLILAPEGSAFQQSVWQVLQKIPYGTTSSYKDIARQIGQPKACRAVGMANNKNPIAIIIPCHRVIGSNGKLVGYAGGLSVKETLLKLEER